MTTLDYAELSLVVPQASMPALHKATSWHPRGRSEHVAAGAMM